MNSIDRNKQYFKLLVFFLSCKKKDFFMRNTAVLWAAFMLKFALFHLTENHTSPGIYPQRFCSGVTE